MSNILNHNRDIFQFDLVREDYWDFHLCIDNSYENIAEGLTERCLSAYIDLSDDECIWFDNVYSKPNYTWENAVNKPEFQFNSFGYTSVDNGRTYYEKDRITNREFFDLFTTTTWKPEENDLRLGLVKVRGNHQLYDYSNDISFWNDTIQCARLNGGWYQGFFCADDGLEYKTLPTDIGSGWNLEFVFNKDDFENDKETLNDVYPENKGIFFYIGTRAENKWWQKYLTDHEFSWCRKTGFADDYVNPEYNGETPLNDDYFKVMVDAYENDWYVVHGCGKDKTPIQDEYLDQSTCAECSKQYVEDEYYEKDVIIDEDMKLVTEGGYDMYQPNIVEVKTDNKYLMFDHTCDGVTADKWEEGTELVLDYVKKPDIGNYFLLFHHGCGGYDANKIQEVLNVKNKEYNVLKDIYRNALAFQVRDDGTLGYKFLVKDCESEEENYKIESEFTKNPVIFNKQWYTVNVKVMPVVHKDFSDDKCLHQNGIYDSMQLFFYVNGKLVLVSRELPMLNLKKLDDLNDKQQGVPFNISIGGGTQGLAEVVYLNYMRLPEYILPLEREFGGSFVGWLKSFKFYTCPLKYHEIVKNEVFNRKTRYLL